MQRTCKYETTLKPKLNLTKNESCRVIRHCAEKSFLDGFQPSIDLIYQLVTLSTQFIIPTVLEKMHLILHTIDLSDKTYHRSTVWVIESLDQLHRGTLSTATRTNQSQCLTRVHIHIQIPQDFYRFPSRITKLSGPKRHLGLVVGLQIITHK